VVTKNTVANAAVLRDKKLALPEAPNRLPELPLPKAAPMSAPLPCWMRISPTMPSAESICTAKIKFANVPILKNPLRDEGSQPLAGRCNDV